MSEHYTNQPPREPFGPDDTPEEEDRPRRKLGSLAQGGRAKELKTVRVVLIVIGVLTIAWNGFQLANLESEVDRELRKVAGGVPESSPQYQQAKDLTMKISSTVLVGTIALGVVFIVLGLLVMSYPVPVTVISLVLYVLANLGFVVAGIVFEVDNPMMILVQGLIIKIVIVVILAKGIQTAIAYEKERAEQEELEPGY
jgi:hypothetical protein